MSEYAAILLITLVLHIVGDGFMQSRYMAENKSSKLLVLFQHIATLSAVLFIGLIYFVPGTKLCTILLLNGCAHFAIDGCIWNVYKIKCWLQAKRQWKRQIPKPEVLKLHPHIRVYTFEEYLQEIFEPDFEHWKDPWFFHFILIDQALHFATFVFLFDTIYH